MSSQDDALFQIGERLRMIQETVDEALADPSKPDLKRYMEMGHSFHPAAPWDAVYRKALEEWSANRTTLFELSSSAAGSLADCHRELAALSASVARTQEAVAVYSRRPSSAAALWVTNVLLLVVLWRAW